MAGVLCLGYTGGGTVLDYHSYLLRTAAYGKGRGRPQFELHMRSFPTEVSHQLDGGLIITCCIAYLEITTDL